MSQAKDAKRPVVPDGCPSMERIVEQWRRERPDIDPGPMAVAGEIVRAGERMRQTIQNHWSEHGLDFPGMDVMLTLRRQGRDQALSPTALAQEMMLSTSAMTNRLDRLEKRGLIERRRDAEDRRGVNIVLTEDGFALVEQTLPSHVETEERALANLSAQERDQLRALLAKVATPPKDSAIKST